MRMARPSMLRISVTAGVVARIYRTQITQCCVYNDGFDVISTCENDGHFAYRFSDTFL